MWSVSTILLGFQSFMLDKDATLGSIEATTRQRKLLAVRSLGFNIKDKQFCECFPHLVETYEEKLKQSKSNETSSSSSNNSGGIGGSGSQQEDLADWRGKQEPSSSTFIFSLGISVALLVVILRVFS